MKIIGISRVRNEEHIILDVLNHVSKLVDQIVIYDDCSTDKTPEICEAHPSVVKVIRGTRWGTTPEERNSAEGDLRTAALKEAGLYDPDWIYCFDADEFADFEGIDFTKDAYKLRLFDYYITPEDVDKNYKDRKYLGPEYRDILMLFRYNSQIVFYQREPTIPGSYKIGIDGYVKHYGKAISVEEWEQTCDYYINHRGGNLLTKFTQKWRGRKGKAIHTISDFGAALIVWEDRKTKGFLLND